MSIPRADSTGRGTVPQGASSGIPEARHADMCPPCAAPGNATPSVLKWRLRLIHILLGLIKRIWPIFPTCFHSNHKKVVQSFMIYGGRCHRRNFTQPGGPRSQRNTKPQLFKENARPGWALSVLPWESNSGSALNRGSRESSVRIGRARRYKNPATETGVCPLPAGIGQKRGPQ